MIGELSQKQKDFLFGERAWINVLHGSVRSSKTTVANLAWLKYISEYTSNEPLLMFGKTERTLKRNVLNPIGDLLGTEISTGSGEFELWGKQIHLVGANDERAVAKIQGPTYGGCYGDEWTLAPRSFTNMLFTRLSVEGAQAFLTCNPEGPYHYCKKDYLDNKNIDLLDWHFTLDDNIHLPESYVENLKRTYTGLFYKRFILGLWVKAEGAVYDMFDEKAHVVKDIDYSNIVRYWVGIDYGTVNPTVFYLLGQHKDGAVYVMREYRWDSKEKGRQKTDSQYADDFVGWIAKAKYSAIYVDPSAVSFALALRNIGVKKVHKADNTVIDGIRNVSTLLSNDLLKIHSSCEGLIKEMSSYVWDETAAERGEDKPIKDSDHGPDAIRYVIRMIFSRYCKPYLRNIAA